MEDSSDTVFPELTVLQSDIERYELQESFAFAKIADIKVKRPHGIMAFFKWQDRLEAREDIKDIRHDLEKVLYLRKFAQLALEGEVSFERYSEKQGEVAAQITQLGQLPEPHS
jgi:tellurite resistance-related uncharacterized protein